MAIQAYFDCVFENPAGKCCLLDSERLADVAYYRADPGWLSSRRESTIFQVPFSRLHVPDSFSNKEKMKELRQRLVLYVCAVTLFPPRYMRAQPEDIIARQTFMQRFIRNVSPLPESIVRTQTELYSAALGALTSPDDADWVSFFSDWMREKVAESHKRFNQACIDYEPLVALRLPQQLDLVYSPGAWEKMGAADWEAALYHFVNPGDVLKDLMWVKNGAAVTTGMDFYWWYPDIANVFRQLQAHPTEGRIPMPETTPEGEIVEPNSRFKARWPVNKCLQLEYDGIVRYIDLYHIWELMGMEPPVQSIPHLAEQGLSYSDYKDWPEEKEGEQSDSKE